MAVVTATHEATHLERGATLNIYNASSDLLF